MSKTKKSMTTTRSKVIKGVKLKVKRSIHRAKILNNVQFCSSMLHLVGVDEQKKKVNEEDQVKGQQKVTMGQ